MAYLVNVLPFWKLLAVRHALIPSLRVLSRLLKQIDVGAKAIPTYIFLGVLAVPGSLRVKEHRIYGNIKRLFPQASQSNVTVELGEISV